MSEYTTNQSYSGPGFHIDCGPPSFTLRDGDREWFMEWHGYCGPTLLHKRTGDPRDRQPGERSRFWCVAQWWHDQGGKVVDGIGVWAEPPIVETKMRKVGRQVFPLDTKVPKGAESLAQVVTLRRWQGYEQYGDPSRYR